MVEQKQSEGHPSGGLDEFDIRILRALTENARATNVEIAHKVGLSEAPCSRRIRRMERDGVIKGYRVELDPSAIGVGLTSFITLSLDVVSAESANEFGRIVGAMPEVLSCFIVSGSEFAILHVAAADLQSYSNFVLDRLRPIPGVKDLRSNLVMRTLKESAALPVLAKPIDS